MNLLTLQDKLREGGAPVDAGTFILFLDNGKRVICKWIDVWMGVFTTHDNIAAAFNVCNFRENDVIPLDSAEYIHEDTGRYAKRRLETSTQAKADVAQITT